MDRYFVAYVCEEETQFIDKNNQIIDKEEILKLAQFKMNEYGSEKRVRIEFDTLKHGNITKQVFHKDKIQILWKPLR